MKIQEFLKLGSDKIGQTVIVDTPYGMFEGVLEEISEEFCSYRREGQIQLAFSAVGPVAPKLVILFSDIIDIKFRVVPPGKVCLTWKELEEVQDKYKFSKAVLYYGPQRHELYFLSIHDGYVYLANLKGNLYRWSMELVDLKSIDFSDKKENLRIYTHGISYSCIKDVFEGQLVSAKTYGMKVPATGICSMEEGTSTIKLKNLGFNASEQTLYFQKGDAEYIQFVQKIDATHVSLTGRIAKNEPKFHNIPCTIPNPEFVDFQEGLEQAILRRTYSKFVKDETGSVSDLPYFEERIKSSLGIKNYEKDDTSEDVEQRMRELEEYFTKSVKTPTEEQLVEKLDRFCDDAEKAGYFVWIDAHYAFGELRRLVYNKKNWHCVIGEDSVVGKWIACQEESPEERHERIGQEIYDHVSFTLSDFFAHAIEAEYDKVNKIVDGFYTLPSPTWDSDSVNYEELKDNMIKAADLLKSKATVFSTPTFNYSEYLDRCLDRKDFRMQDTYSSSELKLENYSSSSSVDCNVNIKSGYVRSHPELSPWWPYFIHYPVSIDSIINFNLNEEEFNMNPKIKKETESMEIQIPWPGANADLTKVKIDTKDRQILVTLPPAFGSVSEETVEKSYYVEERYDMDSVSFSVKDGIVKISVVTNEGVVKTISPTE